MKKIVLLVMGLLFLPLLAAAYQVNIEAPESLTVGKPLVVTGTTTFGIGTPIDVVLYHQLTTTTEVKRKIVYIQPDKTFKAVFDTTGLVTGTYKVEVPTNGMGDSITMRIIQIVDRSDAILITSSFTQPFTGKMSVIGTIKGGENSGIQIEVVGPDDVGIFGPMFVNTNNAGDFSVEVPINKTGEYEVSFTDAKGYIGAKTFTILGEPSVSQIPTGGTTPAVQSLSAHTRTTRDLPAYFIVKTGSGPVSLYTSATVDWVMEYVDEKGTIYTVNNHGDQNAEHVNFTGIGKTMYVRIYPMKPSVSAEGFLYGQNVNSITLSKDVPAAFASTTSLPTTETPQTPVMSILGVMAVGIAVILYKKAT
jgi:hypothetical protein